PIIFLCENNQYALSTATTRTTAGESIAARAAAYAIPGVRVDGNDALAVYEAVGAAVARARRGEGPTLLEAVTYRWGGHSMRANLPEYRTKEEEREWMERDPIARLRNRLVDEKRATPMRLKELEESVELELDRAVEFAKASPAPTVELMASSVYAPHAEIGEPATRAGREITMAEALNEALRGEMERDGRVFVMGEDVGLIGGIFGVTRGLRERFGEDRVRDTPISEATFVGAGVGAAIRDDNPVIFLEHKALNATKGAVPEEHYAIPLGKADVKRAGTDVTVVATQAMVARALAAAAELEKEGVSVEVIDPRTLVPL